MKIDGIIEYNKNGVLSEEKVHIDAIKSLSNIDEDICDAVAFALFGKTVFNEIIRPEKGIPRIFLNIECAGKVVMLVRQPGYVGETELGTKTLVHELFSLSTDEKKYPTLSAEKYFKEIGRFIDLSFVEFANQCKR